MNSIIHPDKIPAELRELDQWVCWRYEDRKGKDTKITINAATGYEADCIDSSEFASFDAAMQRFREYSNLEGVGFAFHSDDGYRSTVNSPWINSRSCLRLGVVNDSQ
jgi:primase-polymerase (primpol)-like protein